jgi:hypothetical protein
VSLRQLPPQTLQAMLLLGSSSFLFAPAQQLWRHDTKFYWALVIGGCSGVGLTFLSNKKTHQPENHLVVIKPTRRYTSLRIT